LIRKQARPGNQPWSLYHDPQKAQRAPICVGRPHIIRAQPGYEYHTQGLSLISKTFLAMSKTVDIVTISSKGQIVEE
jgi:hypothetical protein